MTVATQPGFSRNASPQRLMAAVVWLTALILSLLSSGCAHQRAPEPPSGVEDMAAPVVLHRAAVSVLEERGHDIDVESEKQLFVMTDYALHGDNLKRRYKAEVIRGPEGVMGLKVTVDYKRRYIDDGDETWVPYDTPSLREQARPREVQMGRAIERRFEAWMGR